jgi:hypothetical protein
VIRSVGQASSYLETPALLEEVALRDSVRHIDYQVGEVDAFGGDHDPREREEEGGTYPAAPPPALPLSPYFYLVGGLHHCILSFLGGVLMRMLLLFTFVLTACTMTAPPSEPIHKPVALTVDSSGDGVLLLTRIAAPATTPSGSSLEASARFGGERLKIDFLSPLPTNARQLVVGPDVSLGDLGFFCDLVPGSYPITSEERTGANDPAPRYGSVEVELTAVSGHRRRPSIRGNGPVKC